MGQVEFEQVIQVEVSSRHQRTKTWHLEREEAQSGICIVSRRNPMERSRWEHVGT